MPGRNSIGEKSRKDETNIRRKSYSEKKDKNWVRRIVKRRSRKAAFFRW